MNHVKLGRIPQLVRSCAFAFGGRSDVHPPCLRNVGSFRPCRRSPTARRRRCGDSMASPCAARMLAASFFSPPTIPLRQRPRHQLGHWFIIRESSQQCPFAPVWRPVGRCVGSHSCRPHSYSQGEMTEVGFVRVWKPWVAVVTAVGLAAIVLVAGRWVAVLAVPVPRRPVARRGSQAP